MAFSDRKENFLELIRKISELGRRGTEEDAGRETLEDRMTKDRTRVTERLQALTS